MSKGPAAYIFMALSYPEDRGSKLSETLTNIY
jgi:hypothetical protein